MTIGKVVALIGIGVALAGGSLMAEVTITVDAVRQRAPWNGLVDIDYTVSGLAEDADPNDYQIVFNVTTGAVTFVASNFTSAAWCDHPTANGKQRATWNARADGVADVIPVSVTAQFVYAPITDASAEFAIVDLSSGANSSQYPVRFVAGDTNRTAQFNIDVYKTKKLVLKKVHAGTFWMGKENVSSGTSRHRVRLTKDYFLGLFEVTQRQYLNVCGDLNYNNGMSRDSFSTDSYGERADCRPVGRVLWSIAKSTKTDTTKAGFIELLNERLSARGSTVGRIDFPTEAQWEYACRAGCENRYSFGSDATNALPQYARYNMHIAYDGNGNFSPENYTPRTAEIFHTIEVGRLLPNSWGFYDMHGNVSEWTLDWSSNYPAYSEAEEDITVDPAGPDVGSLKIQRGGSYFRSPYECYSGSRDTCSVEDRGSHFDGYLPRGQGMRLCLGLK